MYEQCIKHIQSHLHIYYDKDLIIDPNAENTKFMLGMQSLAKLVLFYNKKPMLPRVNQLDFCQIDFAQYDKTFLSGLWYDDVHVICQPPPEQADQYIEAACKFAKSVSFILPSTRQYVFPSNYKCLFTTYFENELVFQIHFLEKWGKTHFCKSVAKHTFVKVSQNTLL